MQRSLIGHSPVRGAVRHHNTEFRFWPKITNYWSKPPHCAN